MTIKSQTQYQHLEPRPGSNYRQLFLEGRRIRAVVVDESIHGPDPRTPEEFAQDFQIPLEVVLECSNMWPRIDRSSSRSETVKRPKFAPGARRTCSEMRFLIDENINDSA